MLKFLFIFLLTPSIAKAYLGPGIVGGAMVAILGIILALFIGLAVIIWLPIKSFIKKKKNKKERDLKSKS